MGYIDREKHENLVQKKPDCFNKCDSEPSVVQDLETVMNEYKNMVSEKDIQFASTWLLEKDTLLQIERGSIIENKDVLSRGRVVFVNPGVSGFGREQKFIHPYIVLAEYQETFIGVPITNQAYNKETEQYYLRHFFEVELKNPNRKKRFTEYWCSKPSVADVRNIRGLDKRRIIKDTGKFAPSTYLNAISQKIRESIAIIVPEK